MCVAPLTTAAEFGECGIPLHVSVAHSYSHSCLAGTLYAVELGGSSNRQVPYAVELGGCSSSQVPYAVELGPLAAPLLPPPPNALPFSPPCGSLSPTHPRSSPG